MNLFDSILNPIREANGIAVKNIVSIDNFSSVNTFGTGGVQPDYDTTNFEETYTTVSYVYRAVNATAEAVAGLPVLVQKQVGDEWKNVTTSEFNILAYYNAYMTGYDFWEKTIQSLKLTGESFWLTKRNAQGLITDLYPVPPAYMEVFPKNDFQMDHYIFRSPTGKVQYLRDEDVFFIKLLNPVNAARGLSPLSAAKNDIILDMSAVVSSQRQFSQGFRPSGVFQTEQNMSEAVWKRLLTYLQAEYSGSINTGKALMLTDGLKWEQLSLSNEELQYLGQRQWSKDVVGEVYGVPPVLMMQFKEASVLANADTQVKLFWENTIQPLTRKLEAIFTDFLIPQLTTKKGLRFKFDLSGVSVIQPDMNKLIERMAKGFEKGGVTPNDMSDALGLKRSTDPAANLRYIPMNMMPLGATKEDLSSDTSSSTSNNDDTDDDKKKEDEIKKEADKYLTDLLVRVNKASGNDIAVDSTAFTIQKFNMRIKKADAFGSMNQNIIKVGHKFQLVLEKLLNDQGREVLANLKADKNMTLEGALKSNGFKFKLVDPPNKKYSVDGTNFNFEEWAKKYEAAGQPFIAMALLNAGTDLSNGINEVYHAENPANVAWVNQRAYDYAQMINGTTRDDINRIVARGLQENLTIAELAINLENYFKNNNAMRAIRIARTETVVATNAGRVSSMKQSGRIKDHMWLSQRDSDVRDISGDDHVSLDGTIVKIGDAFPGNGGSQADFPSSPNERCLTIPVQVAPKKN